MLLHYIAGYCHVHRGLMCFCGVLVSLPSDHALSLSWPLTRPFKLLFLNITSPESCRYSSNAIVRVLDGIGYQVPSGNLT